MSFIIIELSFVSHVHVSDGAERCGLVCVLLYVLEQLSTDQDADVYSAVKRMLPVRRQILQSYVSTVAHNMGIMQRINGREHLLIYCYFFSILVITIH